MAWEERKRTLLELQSPGSQSPAVASEDHVQEPLTPRCQVSPVQHLTFYLHRLRVGHLEKGEA